MHRLSTRWVHSSRLCSSPFSSLFSRQLLRWLLRVRLPDGSVHVVLPQPESSVLSVDLPDLSPLKDGSAHVVQ